MAYYLRKHWKINTLVFFLQLLWAALRVMDNVVIMKIFQGVINLDFRSFFSWVIVSLALSLFGALANGARSWAKAKAIRSMNNRVRCDITATILRKSHQEFHAQQNGEYLSWYTNDVTQIERLAWDSFYGIISVTAQIVFSIIVLASIHWSFLAASIFATALIIGVPSVLRKRVGKLSETCAKEQAQAMSKLKDMLSGIDVLRSFGRMDHLVEENQAASDQLEKPKYKLKYVQSFAGEGISLVSVVCQMLVFTLAGFLSIRGVIIQSAIAGCGNMCSTVYNGLTQVGQLVLAVQASKPYFEKITVHADNRRYKTDSQPVFALNSITVESLNFRYDEKPVLENVSFQFDKGGKYALTGPSGCGKSTLLKLLLGWLPNYTGTICFNGKDAKDFPAEQLQCQMSYIGQDVFVFNSTIRDNITLGDKFTDESIERAVRNSALDGDLANMPLGLDTPVGENGSNLSGGQKQRVAIARALIHSRSILLVDEGTSALDQKNADIVEQSLLSNPDLTLILVSHHLTPDRKAQFTKVYQLNHVTDPVPDAAT